MNSRAGQAPEREYMVFNVDRNVRLAERVRIAGTSASRRRGLRGIDRFESFGGLWIAPCEAIHTFGMKIAIDAVFLDRQFRIRRVRPDLRPGRIAVCLRADSVLELAAGVLARTGTVAGDRLRFEPVARTQRLEPVVRGVQ